ncbi:Uncharacterised protein [Actinomyces viscosus]|uniref:Uncharacterized protein n=3 Tax=Actinomyces viscosus TaxID=1656 RepID=A0A3S4Z6K3_ACTVI|nr:Uncharacterised protein [Actinomyces viscosus]
MLTIMGMVACVIGLPLSLVDLWRYLSGPRPTLVIDSVGVHDHLNRDSVGLIRWEEIEGFNARTLNGWLKIGNNDCVLVYLRAPQATLERLRPTLPPRVTRRMERSFSHGHTTIPIPALLGIPVTSMTSLLRDEMGGTNRPLLIRAPMPSARAGRVCQGLAAIESTSVGRRGLPARASASSSLTAASLCPP